MVKLGKAFSIVAVFALLILLAPAVMLLPGGNAVQANPGANPGQAVTQEVEASFTFTEADPGGDWYTFEAGSKGLQPDPGDARLALVQYTRDNVVLRETTVPGCGFRNYTTASVGSVNSTLGELNGTMTLEWITLRFNYTHPDQYNETFSDFGWMAGRGHYYDEGNTANNFTFVFVADLDCDDEMTNADGKGYMLSVEENGRFGNMADPPELRHKIIGDFEISKAGTTYTGNFHLRNYPPNEVYDSGMLNVTGGVLSEWLDDISAGSLELANITSDGPMSTPADAAYPTGFEEIDWGKDPIKTIIDSGRLGGNATMDISRNCILYLNQTVIDGDTYIRIQANPICNLFINDTYAVTGGDGTAYGELLELLLMSLPYQMVKVDPAHPLFFNQTGYTFQPFGLVKDGFETTGCYAGAESFANAEIFIEATTGTAYQYSYDVAYGLCPHPKVTSVTPNNGNPGQTLNVTINGKYFLRADNTHPNSGSVSFEQYGITVNDYTVKNSSAIEANITIASSPVWPGPRDVTVTSCFGYDDGNGTAPYKSGCGEGVFNVNGVSATLNGSLFMMGSGTGWETNFTIRYFDNGTGTEVTEAVAVDKGGTTDQNGNFSVDVVPGRYDIGVKCAHALSVMEYNVTIAAPSTPVAFANFVYEGDPSGDDMIVMLDLTYVLNSYGSTYKDCDFDRSGVVVMYDLTVVLNSYGFTGDIYNY